MKEDPIEMTIVHVKGSTVEGALSSAQLVATAALRAINPSSDQDETDNSEPEENHKESSPHRKTHWKSQSVSETNETTNSFNQNRELWQRRAASQGHIDPPQNPTLRHSQELWELRQKHTPDLVMDLPLVGSSSPKEGNDKSISEEDSSSSESSSPGPESPDMTTAAERFAKQNQCTLKKNTKVNLPRKSNEILNDNKTSSEVDSLENILNSEKINQVKSELELVINPVAHQQRLTPKMAVKFSASNNSPSNTVPSKPQLKQKPQILRKPVLPLPVPPNQTSTPDRKDAHD